MPQASQAHPVEVARDLDFTDPSGILRKLDPELRGIFSDWVKGFKKGLHLHATQQELTNKYEMIEAKGELLRRFADEAKKKWQFPVAYRAVASPLLEAGEDLADMDDYDLDKAWQKMKERHAKEQHDFVIAHQRRCSQLAAEWVTFDRAKESLRDAVVSWVA